MYIIVKTATDINQVLESINYDMMLIDFLPEAFGFKKQLELR